MKDSLSDCMQLAGEKLGPGGGGMKSSLRCGGRVCRTDWIQVQEKMVDEQDEIGNKFDI